MGHDVPALEGVGQGGLQVRDMPPGGRDGMLAVLARWMVVAGCCYGVHGSGASGPCSRFKEDILCGL